MRLRASPVLIALLVCLLAPAAQATGVLFVGGSTSDALAGAKAANKRVMVEIWASWCAPCHLQAKEVFDTPEGAALTRGLLSLKVDFDAEDEQRWVKQWNVLRLPTVLFLRPDGSEIDRLEGYEDREMWLAHARRAAAGHDPVIEMEERLKAFGPAAKEKAALSLRVRLGHAYLVRGDVGRGAGFLEQAIQLDERRSGASAQALYHLGRYWSRVKNDYEKGAEVWQRLLVLDPYGPQGDTAAWWSASAFEELKREREADQLMQTHVANRPTADRLELGVQWVEKTRRPLATIRPLLSRLHLDRERREGLQRRYDDATGAGK